MLALFTDQFYLGTANIASALLKNVAFVNGIKPVTVLTVAWFEKILDTINFIIW